MAANIFESETAMQLWLSKKFSEGKSLAELVCNLENFIEKEFSDIIASKIYKTFLHCTRSFYIHEVISENENISFKPGDILKPDFLVYAPETESILIVELKNISGPSRQAGTEISAYASEIKSYIPFISEGDIINIIISPVWTTLLKHYVLHELFWLQRNIICLQPCMQDGEISLEIVEIENFIDDSISLRLSEKHLGGYQLCLYDYSKSDFEGYIDRMKSALHAMAAKGNSQKNHGFAFLWEDHWELSRAPYSITVLNFAPFNSLERFFHDEEFEPSEITERFIGLVCEHNPEGHGESLEQLVNASEPFLKDFCTPRAEGFTTWQFLRDTMISRGTLKSFRTWGIFEELLSEKILSEYKKGNTAYTFDSPEIGLKLIGEIVDEDYQFIDLTYYNYDPDEDYNYAKDNLPDEGF